MGENSLRVPDDRDHAVETLPVPPQVLARWAAIAGARSALSSLPHQVRVVAS